MSEQGEGFDMKIFDLTGKRAVITGGYSGIGKAASEALCDAGAEIMILDINPEVEKAQETVDPQAHGICCDLLDRRERKHGFEQAVAFLGGIDILINNAGLQHKEPILEFPDEAWDAVLELNLNCTFSLCKYAGRHMIGQRYGKIINIASMNSFFGGTNACAYAASKGAIVQFTKALANEWSKYGINANAIAPGFVETGMTAGLCENREYKENKTSRIPAGRWASPGDLKGAFVFLASPASDYLCGTVIPVDGGYLAK